MNPTINDVYMICAIIIPLTVLIGFFRLCAVLDNLIETWKEVKRIR